MYRYEKTPREEKFLSPSFSSTLLDQIYRSIDEGERKSGDTKFYRETTTRGKKQWTETDRKENNKLRKEKVEVREVDNRKQQHHRYVDHEQDVDVMFFSSTSISSDSSSGGFSSSDTESRASCFAPPRPKPVRTSASFRWEKQGTTTTTTKNMFDGFCRNSNNAKQGIKDETLIKSKSRALKIYNNLKKVKQPISPGGRLTSFLNSLFQTGNTKSKKNNSGTGTGTCSERKTQAYTCSSASSFSRSCLSKTSSYDRDVLCNGVKRTVRFMEEEELKFPTTMGEETSRGFLREYINNQKKKDLAIRRNVNEDEDDDDDDAASYASSDLFELDHLAVLGNGRYCEELPVYETTHVSTNRAIANGLIV